jgi:hypothetical protein
MTNPKITRRQIIKGAAAVGALGAVGLPSVAFADGGDEGGTRIRWDLISLLLPHISAGGSDTASAVSDPENPENLASTLTLTGHGTFSPGHSRQVTGGGTWRTTNPDVPGGPGTYRVTELISWTLAPGTLFGSGLTDDIGALADTRAGLAVLRVKYSDGLDGVLFLSCNIDGTPKSVDEGITVSRGFVNFFAPAKPNFTQDSNRTLFHALREGAQD